MATVMGDGWVYDTPPSRDGDCRKLVSLEQDGMCWVGVRAYYHVGGYWANNNEPEPATVKAWRDMPNPARGFYDRGKLTIPGI